MTALDVVVQRLEAVPGQLVGLLLDRLLHVQHRRVVELGERVDEQLPVRVDLGPVGVGLGHLVEGIALQALREVAEVVGQRFGVVVEVDEDEALPDLAAHRHQPVVGLVEVEELVLLLDEGQVALQAVAPGVVLAGELTAGAGHLLARIVVPHQLVSAVAAHVVERPDLVVGVLDDDHRRAGPADGISRVK